MRRTPLSAGGARRASRRLLIVVLMSLLLLTTGIRESRAQQPEVAEAPGRLSGVTRLIDLGFADLRATGARPVIDVFFPGPGDFALRDGSMLTLYLAHSNLLVPRHSSVTITLNGRALKALALDASNVDQMRYDVPVPTSLIRKDFNQLRLEFAMTLGNDCEDGSNPALFATLLRESQLTFAFASDPPAPALEQPSLAAYPYPFFRSGYPVVAPVALVLPDEPLAEEVAAAYRIAISLFTRVAFDIDLLEMRMRSELTASDMASRQLIVLGTPGRQPLLTELLPRTTVAASGSALTRNGNTLAEDAGFLGLVESPWNKQLQVLMVSGATQAALLRSVDALVNVGSSSLLAGPEALLTEPLVVDALPQESATAFTFAQLGANDRTVSGERETSLDLTFNAPALAATANARLDLLVSTPSSLDRRRSNLVVELNGQRVETVQLRDTEMRRVSYQVALPRDVFEVGANTLRLRTTLYSLDPSGFGPCQSIASERLWATYHGDSAISLSLVLDEASTAQTSTLAALPVPFSGVRGLRDTTFLVHAGRPASLRAGMIAAVALGRRGTPSDVRVALADTATRESIGDRHVVAVGLQGGSPLAAEISEALPVVFQAGGSRALVNKDATLTEVLDSARVGAAQETSVPWAPARKLLTLNGTDDLALGWVSEALLTTGLEGNVALFRSAKQVNSFTLERRSDADIARELQDRFAPRADRARIVAVFLPIVGVVVLVLLGWLLVPKIRGRLRHDR